MATMRRDQHSELAHSWPAIVFGAAILAAFVSVWLPTWKIVSVVLLVAAFVPCGLIRDWWVKR